MGARPKGPDDLRAVLAVAVVVLVRKLPRVIEVLSDFQFRKSLALLQMDEFRMILEFHSIKLQRAESRLNEVESGISHLRCPLIPRRVVDDRQHL